MKAGRKICRVRPDDDGRRTLQEAVDSGRGSRERRQRARILLLADEARDGGGRTDVDIADVLGVGTVTVERVRRRCVEEGLEASLERRVQNSRKQRLLDGAGEARLTMLACPEPPEGRARWTLNLLGIREVGACCRHFSRNLGRMRYDRFRDRGIQVGSGVVEGGCRQFGLRMKRPGTRWSKRGASAMLALKACVMNLRLPDLLDWQARQVVAA